VLGYPDMATAADAVPALLAYSPIALEGLDARIVNVVRGRKGAAAVPDLPAAKAGCSSNSAAPRRPRSPPARKPRFASRRRRDGWIVPHATAVAALWRIRETAPAWPRGPPTRPDSRLGGRRRTTSATRHYLRDFEALMRDRGSPACPTAIFGDAASTSASTSR